MTVPHNNSNAAREMTEASANFLRSLSPDQRVKATYQYMDGERFFWYYPPLSRHGLPLREMDAGQRNLAHAIMASGLTDASYKQAKLIIEHEDVLGPVGRVQYPIPVDPTVADELGRVEHHPALRGIDELKVADVGKQVGLHDPHALPARPGGVRAAHLPRPLSLVKRGRIALGEGRFRGLAGCEHDWGRTRPSLRHP